MTTDHPQRLDVHIEQKMTDNQVCHSTVNDNPNTSHVAGGSTEQPPSAKWVPSEPTDAQQEAGAQAVRIDTTLLNKLFTANRVYRAMIAAAPPAPGHAERAIERAPERSSHANKDAERYRFIRSMKGMPENQVEIAGNAMASVFDPDAEGIPTDAEFDACIDAAKAALAHPSTAHSGATQPQRNAHVDVFLGAVSPDRQAGDAPQGWDAALAAADKALAGRIWPPSASSERVGSWNEAIAACRRELRRLASDRPSDASSSAVAPHKGEALPTYQSVITKCAYFKKPEPK